MFTNPKKTHLFIVATLATTFVYYHYHSSPRGSVFNLQFSDAEGPEAVQISSVDVKRLMQEHPGLRIKDSILESSASSSRNQNGTPSASGPEGIASGKDSHRNANEQRQLGGQGNDGEMKKYEQVTPQRTEKKNDALDIVIVNNKVYHKNDTIPRKDFKLPVLQPSCGKFLKNIDLDRYSNKDRKFLKDRRKKMLSRARTLAATCGARSKLIESKKVHLVWDQSHDPKIVWCPQYKVASTTWMINFLRLAHFNENNPELEGLKPKKKKKLRFKVKYGAKHDSVYRLYPPPAEEKVFLDTFRHSLRVIIVRHPFTRILSAYRDKMTKMDPKPPQYLFRDLQLRIIAKYRPVDSPETSPFPTFPEFIQYVLDSTRTYWTAEDWLQKVHCWTPYWAQCNVCGVDYNVVMKLETMEEDQRFLVTVSNLEELKDAEEWRHLHNNSSTDLAPEYFKQLTSQQVRQLYLRYKLDFLLFDYKIEDVYDMPNEDDDDDYDDE